MKPRLIRSLLILSILGCIVYANRDAVIETVSSATDAMKEAAGVKIDESGLWEDLRKAQQKMRLSKTGGRTLLLKRMLMPQLLRS